MPSCPACRRAVAIVRASCIYCGAPLPPEDVVAEAAAPGTPSATPAETPAPAPSPRVLVLVDLAAAAGAALAEALGVSPYEAALLARRGGLHLVRAALPAEAEAEAERLRGLGAPPWLVPEAEVRTPPLPCLSGERQGAVLLLRTPSGSAAFPDPDALLAVRGAITREYQVTPSRRHVAIARPAEGLRVHLHRRHDPQPLEIDALDFEVGFAVSGGVQLEIDAWLQAVASLVPRDDAFSRLPPALAPAQAPAPGGALSAFESLAATRGEAEGRVVLDNLAQFRFYSGCLAAVARRRAQAVPPTSR